MANDFDRARELYTWEQRFLSRLGVWPLEATYGKYTFWSLYVVIHITTELADLYEVSGDLQLMILNISETTLETTLLLKLMLLRWSGSFKQLIIEAIEGTNPDFYDGPEEKEIYLSYSRVARTFYRAGYISSIISGFMYHLKPLEFRLKAALSNETQPFVLPYRTRFFFDVDDSRTFWLVLAYQSPMIYMHVFNTVAIAVIFALVIHVCGLLAVLSFKIRNLNTNVDSDTGRTFGDIVERHLVITRMAKSIDDTFCMMLLEEFVTTTVILGLVAYNFLVNSDTANTATTISFLMYEMVMLLIVFAYCLAGEFLITESTKLHDAFYECEWDGLSNSLRKQLSICMAATNKPLSLTGGGFYVFSMEAFTGILKSSMAYVSMLRTLI